jgi:tRNA(fMet)-specific endonuclease VapC
MSPKFMLDTNICIHLIKHQPPEVRQRFEVCFIGDIVISAITLAELEYGIACSPPETQAINQLALEGLLEDLVVAPFDKLAARAYGPVRLANKVRQRDALDKLIASHAIAMNVTLVTNNEADFAHYQNLKFENWVNSH